MSSIVPPHDADGPYRYLFGQRPKPWQDEYLQELSDRMLAGASHESELPAAYTYFGQFLAHDLTWMAIEESLTNRRTPRLDLDALYGSTSRQGGALFHMHGKHAGTFLHGGLANDDVRRERDLAQQRLHADKKRWGVRWRRLAEEDLPRDSENRALIGDPRNDATIMLAELHRALMLAHDAMLASDHVAKLARAEGPTGLPGGFPIECFRIARRELAWHVQWVLLHDFLPKVLHRDEVKQLQAFLAAVRSGSLGSLVPPRSSSGFLPCEFTLAAFRFGHSMVRSSYQLNEAVPTVSLSIPGMERTPRIFAFDTHLMGGDELPSHWEIDWRYFVDLHETVPIARKDGSGRVIEPQKSMRIDTSIASELAHLPEWVHTDQPGKALPYATMKRGERLVSGQEIARALGVEPLQGKEEPAWFYMLRESEERGEGRLGRTASILVRETFTSVLLDDANSFVRQRPAWTPWAWFGHGKRKPETYALGDLLHGKLLGRP
ncbi:MAG: hypothetical protein H6833_07055 [Planctomycetes bacterium]|nr:hypothetical protein [Planctomycetota bacterium]